jgi:hypothetical protein
LLVLLLFLRLLVLWLLVLLVLWLLVKAAKSGRQQWDVLHHMVLR